MPICCVCNKERPRASFSRLQLRHKASDNRKCRKCVKAMSVNGNGKDEKLRRMCEKVKQHILSDDCKCVLEDFKKPSDNFDLMVCHVGHAFVLPRLSTNIGLFPEFVLQEARERRKCDVAAGYKCIHIIDPSHVHETMKQIIGDLLDLLSDFNDYSGCRPMLLVSDWADKLVSLHGLDSLVAAVEAINAMSADAILQDELLVASVFAKISLILQAYYHLLPTTLGFVLVMAEEMRFFAPWMISLHLDYVSMESDRKMVRAVAKWIPCDCLDHLKDGIDQTSTTVCFECRKRFPSSEIKRCAGCGILKYCSKRCQKRNWNAYHKFHCSIWRKKLEESRSMGWK